MRALLCLTACALPLPAAGLELTCVGPALRADVIHEEGTCVYEGEAARLMQAPWPLVCHISDPQLRILTVSDDLTFVYEDTDTDRIVRGRCSAAD